MISRRNPFLRTGLAVFAALLLFACTSAYAARHLNQYSLGHNGSTTNQVTKNRVIPLNQPVALTASLQASPLKYTGASPAHIRFRGTITANAACVVKYRFTKSDGSTSNERTLSFNGAATKNVSDGWSVSQNTSGWEAISVTSLQSVESNKARFEVKFGGTGLSTLSSGRPKLLGRRTQDNGSTSSSASSAKTGSDSDAKNIKIIRSGDHHLTITPIDGVSKIKNPRIVNVSGLHKVPGNVIPGRNVHASAAAGVTATLGCSLSRYFGSQCPIAIHFNGNIKASAPCTVKYVFDRSDGATMQPQTLVFDHAGTQHVKDGWSIKQSYTGWEQLRIISPAPCLSDKANFVIQFRAKKP